MREFFRGWKRAVGVVTLGLACAFATLWLRSHEYVDMLTLRKDKCAAYFYVSDRQCLKFFASSHAGLDPIIWQVTSSLKTEPLRKQRANHVLAPICSTPPTWNWRWQAAGCQVGNANWTISGVNWRQITKGTNVDGDFKMFVLSLPHWLIILPLTLLSAWLLSKPRQTAPKRLTEPAPTTGA
jgi:hypothetical protein